MLTMIGTFLGSTAFRLIFGGVMEYMNKSQEHRYEQERMKAQQAMDQLKYDQEMSRVRMQADLKLTELEQTSQMETRRHLEAIQDAVMQMRATAVEATTKLTGNKFIDSWNQGIRPAGATVSMVLWVLHTIIPEYIVLSEFSQVLVSSFLGLFVGERIHAKLTK